MKTNLLLLSVTISSILSMSAFAANITTSVTSPELEGAGNIELVRPPELCPLAPLVGESFNARCDDFPPPEVKTKFPSGYSINPDRTFNTTATRYRSICERWDGQEPHLFEPESVNSLNYSEAVIGEETIEHQVTTATQFLDKTPQLVEPTFQDGRICVEWREQAYSVTTGHVSIRYGNDNRLDKPLILVQGYQFSYDGFEKNSVADERDIVSSFVLDQDDEYKILNNAFTSGRDIVIFRYAMQDDGIESNAWALASLIEELAKSSSDIRVAGYSMGGVVGKLAIQYLGHKGVNHKVSHFSAVDSPFKGVHIPDDVKRIADEIENQANKMRCGFKIGGRSSCRRERDRLRSINDIFSSYTFKQLDEGSPENRALQSRINDLEVHFDKNIVSRAYSLGAGNGSRIPHVYTGNAAEDLKLDVRWRLSGNRRSALVATANEARNGSYINTYQIISQEVRANDEFSSIRKETNDPLKGRHTFVTDDSAFNGKKGFDNYEYFRPYEHLNHTSSIPIMGTIWKSGL